MEFASPIMRTRARWMIVIAMLGVGGAIGSSCSSDEQAPGARAQGCNLASDCAAGLSCIFQRCHAVCNESRDCDMPKGERCVKLPPANVCQLADEMYCTYTSECPMPLKCAVDSKCRAACRAKSDCLANQVCTMGVCADPDQIDVNTGGLPVTNDAGYRGEDGGAEDASTGSETGGDAPAERVDLPEAGDEPRADVVVAEGGAKDAVPDAPADADDRACGSDSGVLGRFHPSNLPVDFTMPTGTQPWVLATSCAYDTDTLVGTGCGANFATRTASADVALSDGRRVAVLMADSVTINGGAKLSLSGTRPFILLANGKVEINGTIQAAVSDTNFWWGGGAPGASSGDRVGICALPAGPGGGGKGNSAAMAAGAGGGGFCGAGGRGSGVADAGVFAAGGMPYGNVELVPLVGGSGGGSALGGFTPTLGTNHGGGAVQIVSGDSILIGDVGVVDMGGGFPNSPSSSVEGGGGGSGGAILLEAPSVTVNGVLAANGGGGGGGYLQHGLPGQPSSTPATGGGLGGSGSGGTVASGSDAKIGSANDKAGGGGGGAGRIRINTGCGGMLTLSPSSVVSPDKTSGCYTEGALR
jgi:hypothetical protein